MRILAETVRLVAHNAGVLLVPSFAIGRTQDIVYELDRLIDQGAIPLLPLYLDSPMGSKATDVCRHHVEMPERSSFNGSRTFDLTYIVGESWLGSPVTRCRGAFRARPTWRRCRSAGSSRTETADGPGAAVVR